MQAHDLLARKEALGNRASYRKLSDRIGVNWTSIRQTLIGEESAIPIDRDKIASLVSEALDEIEAEGDTHAQAA